MRLGPEHRRLAARRARARTRRGRWVDAAAEAAKPARQPASEATPNASTEAAGRSVDVEARNRATLANKGS